MCVNIHSQSHNNAPKMSLSKLSIYIVYLTDKHTHYIIITVVTLENCFIWLSLRVSLYYKQLDFSQHYYRDHELVTSLFFLRQLNHNFRRYIYGLSRLLMLQITFGAD